MKESIKMEDYDGYLERFTKEHRTKILPLRWFANLCEKPAAYHLEEAMRYDDYNNHGTAYKLHAKLSNFWYKPYLKWGTVYKLDFDVIKKAWENDPEHQELMKRLTDYNENGIPYWEEDK